jgi:hypothetical protein
VEDWVDDNIVHPLTGPFYSIADAIGDLAPDGFSIYGSSPHFLTDWRWYKQVYGAACRFNDRAVTTYHQNIVNLLDYRITLDPHDAAFGERLLAVCNDLHGLMLANDAGDAAVLPAAIAGVRRLAALLDGAQCIRPGRAAGRRRGRRRRAERVQRPFRTRSAVFELCARTLVHRNASPERSERSAPSPED